MKRYSGQCVMRPSLLLQGGINCTSTLAFGESRQFKYSTLQFLWAYLVSERKHDSGPVMAAIAGLHPHQRSEGPHTSKIARSEHSWVRTSSEVDERLKLQSRGQSRGIDSGKKSLRPVTRSSTGHRHALCHGRVVTLIVTPAGGLSSLPQVCLPAPRSVLSQHRYP